MSKLYKNRNIQIEESAFGSAIVSGDGNTIYVIQQTTEKKQGKTASKNSIDISSNPYKGLAAFKEHDTTRYFGREAQIERLYKRFQALYGQDKSPRFLPILGPSGCGKSSLVRAGFLPELARRPLPGKENMSVAVMRPGTRPLETLASVLAKVVTNDPLPLEKTEEFERVLKKTSTVGEYEGLRRIAHIIPNIQDRHLIVLVDQFEEIYSLCQDIESRQAFIGNLLHAAGDSAGEVSVAITLRSDFWEEVQRHEQLNQLIGSDQSVNVPAMTKVELRRAIAEPAKQAGTPLDEGTIALLIEQTLGHRGALPLLQFALTRIWDGLSKGNKPVETLNAMGGVGGALANEAQQLYKSLNLREQQVARRIFLRLVQLSPDSSDVRRRPLISELIADDSGVTSTQVRLVIGKFSAAHVRFLSTSIDKDGQEKVEITHESLIHQWEQLNDWLSESRQALRKNRKIEESAQEWIRHHRSSRYLLEGYPLQSANIFRQGATLDVNLSSLANEYLDQSLRKKRLRLLKLISVTAILPLCGTLFLTHYGLLGFTHFILQRRDCEPTTWLKGLLTYQYRTQKLTRRYPSFNKIALCHKELDDINLSGANIENVYAESVSLDGAILADTVLTGTNLRKASIIGADLQRAVLNSSNLSEANLESADLSQAFLDSADLTDTILKNTRLYEVDLSQTKGLSAIQVQQAELCHVKLPANVTINLPGIENRDCPQ